MRWCLDCETEYPDTMDRCPSCGGEFFTDEPISAMPPAKVERGRTDHHVLSADWPVGEDGKPVKPALLENILSSSQLDYDMHIGLLNSSGIPTLKRFPRDGSLGSVILGFSGSGLDIYVPETMLEEAKIIIDNREDLN